MMYAPNHHPQQPYFDSESTRNQQIQLQQQQHKRFNSMDDETFYVAQVPGLQSHSSHSGIRRTNSTFLTNSGTHFADNIDLSSASYAR
jgi:hypothetical protein